MATFADKLKRGFKEAVLSNPIASLLAGEGFANDFIRTTGRNIADVYKRAAPVLTSSGLAFGGKFSEYAGNFDPLPDFIQDRYKRAAPRMMEHAARIQTRNDYTGTPKKMAWEMTKDFAPAVVYTAGLANMPAMLSSPATLGMTGGIGVLSKTANPDQTYGEALGNIASFMPYVYGVTSATDPILRAMSLQGATPLANKLGTSAPIAERLIAAPTNVAQGIAIDRASGTPTTPFSVAADIGIGLGLGASSYAANTPFFKGVDDAGQTRSISGMLGFADDSKKATKVIDDIGKAIKAGDNEKAVKLYMDIPETSPLKEQAAQQIRQTDWFKQASKAPEPKTVEQMLQDSYKKLTNENLDIPRDEGIARYFADRFPEISDDPSYWKTLQKAGWDENKLEYIGNITKNIMSEQGGIKDPPAFNRYMLRNNFPDIDVPRGIPTEADLKLSPSDMAKADATAKRIASEIEDGTWRSVQNIFGNIAEPTRSRDQLVEELEAITKRGGQPGDTEYSAISKQIADLDETATRVPRHQKLLEDAINANDQKRAVKIFKDIPSDDPYKESVRRFLDRKGWLDSKTVKGILDKSKPSPLKAIEGDVRINSEYFRAGYNGDSLNLNPVKELKSADEVADQITKAREYFAGRSTRFGEKLSALGIENEEFVRLKEQGKAGMTKNLRQLADEFDDILEQAKTYSGADITERPAYFPHIWEESRVKEEVFPNLFLDRMNLSFKNMLPRLKGAEGYITDPVQVLKDYSDRAIMHRNWDYIQAERLGVPVEYVRKHSSIAEAVTKAIKEDNFTKAKTLDGVEELMEMKRKAGIDYDNSTFKKLFKDSDFKSKSLKTVKKKISVQGHYLSDARTNLKKIGLWEDGFKEVFMSKGFADRYFYEEVAPYLVEGDLQMAVRRIAELDPNTNMNYVMYHIKKNMDSPEDLLAISKYLVEKGHKNTALDNLFERLGGIEKYADGFTRDKVNEYLNIEVGRKVKIEDTTARILNEVKRWTASGALGLNVSPVMNNFTEIKRVIPVTSADSFAKAVGQVGADNKNILELYAVEDYRMEDFIKNVQAQDKIVAPDGKQISKDALLRILGKGLDKKHQIDDKVLAPFKWSEKMKDKVFLYALDAEADKLGLKGNAKTDFVLENFNEYANKFGGLNTVGLFRNKYASTIFQFAQYAVKEANIYLNEGGTAWRAKGKLAPKAVLDDKSLKAIFKNLDNHEKAAYKYLTEVGVFNMGLWLVLGSALGYDLDRIVGATPFDIGIDRGGLNLGAGIVPGTLVELYHGLQEKKEGKEFLNRRLKRELALYFPAGNQLLNKTYSGVGDMLRGYNESATGLMRFPTQPNAIDTVRIPAFGSYSTPEASRYFDEDLTHLSENQTERYANLYKQDPDLALDYYESLLDRREGDNTSLTSMLKSGKEIDDPDVQKIINSRQQTIDGLVKQGVTDPGEIADVLDEQAKASGFDAHDFTEREIKAYLTASDRGKPMSIMDIINKNAELSDTRSTITDVLTGDDFEGWSEADRMKVLQAEGISTQDVEDWKLWKLSSTKVNDRADWIASNRRTDFVKLYEQGVLTKGVADRLEQLGYIADADDLMEKLKLSDPYVRRQAQKELQKDYTTKSAKARAKTMKSILKAGADFRAKQRKEAIKGMNSLLKTKPKYSKVKLDTSLVNKLDDPKPYKVMDALKL